MSRFNMGDLVLVTPQQASSSRKAGYGVVMLTCSAGISREGKSNGDDQKRTAWVDSCYEMIHRPTPDVSKELRS